MSKKYNDLSPDEKFLIDFFSNDTEKPFGEHYKNFQEFLDVMENFTKQWKAEKSDFPETKIQNENGVEWFLHGHSNRHYITLDNRVFTAFGYHGYNCYRILVLGGFEGFIEHILKDMKYGMNDLQEYVKFLKSQGIKNGN